VQEIQRHLDQQQVAPARHSVIERWGRPLLQPERSLKVAPS
jgi:hypothetical protein